MAEIYKIGSDEIVDRVSEFGGTNLLGATANLVFPTVAVSSASFTYGLIAGYNSSPSLFTLEPYDDSSNSLVLNNDTATGNRGAAGCCKPGAITAGTTYTFSCLLKPSIAITAHMHTGGRNGSATASYIGGTSQNNVSIPANTGTQYKFTFGPNSDAQLTGEFLIGMCFTGKSDGVTCRFAHPKLEKSNYISKTTDGTPAPQDLVKISGTALQLF